MTPNIESEDYSILIDHINRDEWESLLQSFNDATIYQTWSYGAVRWGQDNLSHIVIKEKGEFIAAAQLRILKLPLLDAGIAYLPWGPMWQRRGQNVKIETFQLIINALKNEYTIKQGLLLRVRPHINDENCKEIISILKQEGFRKNLDVPPYKTLMLDLSPTLADIRKYLNQKWRNQLNRSEKNNLRIIEGNSDELYKLFLVLQKEMHNRKKYIPGIDYSEFREIQKSLPNPLKMIILICEFGGKVLTATIVSKIGDTGIYLLGATGDEGMKMKGAYLSQWRAIEMMKNSGCLSYDLGGIDPDHNPGVYHFKSGISHKEVRHVGQYEISNNIISCLIVKGAETMTRLQRKIYNYCFNSSAP